MHPPIYAVEWFEIVGDYTLRVGFDDQTVQTIDLTEVLRGRLYGPLRDPAVFNAVAIDPVAKTLVWPTGADFDPTILHDWPERGRGMKELVRGWHQ